MKKLVRSRTNRKLAGIIGGLSDYLNMDDSLLRIIFVALFIFTGFFPVGLIYLIGIYLIPNEKDLL
jgi:phage shock protein C